ncbi:MAG: diacylglycerol kinase family protein [Bacteroidetes bacterium]|nr:MAG: diacylglycerol kinase family protein [Bacteroidota bacterium]
MDIRSRLISFKYAFRGLLFLFKGQPNAWIHLVAAVGVIVAGILFRLSTVEWLFVMFAIGFVFSAELFNSAVEELVNKVSPEEHPLAGKVKDLAAGAVLVAAITAAVIGGIVFVPKIF